ncbi:MAG TPA: MinD/ParA family protein [Bacillota bacterium]|nr:MinD/ParA family protein [Bacillota bacterium]HNT02283.1 MinD/ParA family protein [Bacillota bacterium]
MKDQAERLREIISSIKNYKDEEKRTGILTDKPGSRVIAVTSGKGGVGKTNFTVNLGIKFAQMGLRVVIIDADLGLANVDVVMGKMSKYNLSDVINSNKNILEILEEGYEGVKFVSGGSGVQELVKLNRTQLVDLLMKLGRLDEEADIILIDTGAGLSENVISFVHAAREVILVTTPEPTSITDAYALIKTITHKDKTKNIKVVVNRADNAAEAFNILDKLNIVTQKFLGVKLQKLGYILNDTCVTKAVKIQQPFVISFARSEASKNMNDIALTLMDNKELSPSSVSGIKMFINKLTSLFN